MRKNTHLAELLKLPPVERLEAANSLLDSLQDDLDNPDWEEIWSHELKRRLAGLQDGSRQPVPSETVFANARRRLHKLDG